MKSKFYARFQVWENGGTQTSSAIFDNVEAYEMDVQKANQSFAETTYKEFDTQKEAADWIDSKYESIQ